MTASQLCSAPSPLFSQVTLGDVIDDEADYWLSSAGMVLDRSSLAAAVARILHLYRAPLASL